jgi:hypothetical protein
MSGYVILVGVMACPCPVLVLASPRPCPRPIRATAHPGGHKGRPYGKRYSRLKGMIRAILKFVVIFPVGKTEKIFVDPVCQAC